MSGLFSVGFVVADADADVGRRKNGCASKGASGLAAVEWQLKLTEDSADHD